MANEQQPLLPAAPIYKSDVFIKGAGAVLTQIVSLGFRVAKYFNPEIGIDEEAVQGFIADGLQIVAAALALWSLASRKNSAIAPLTYTASGAAKQNAENPPMLGADPTKTPAPQQTATMSTKEPSP
jgi:hypothetical protein